MKFWERKQANDVVYVGVSTAVASGASPDEWIRQAIHRISILTGADRVGVWLDTEAPLEGLAYGLFRGSVWDRDNPETPAEWRQLSTEAPLPGNVLSAKGSAAVDLGASRESALLGPLLELRHALWVPIQVQRQLRGIILAGSKARTSLLSAAPVEGIAAELALALELSQVQRNALSYRADLEVTRAALQAVGNGVTPEAMLQLLVRSSLEILKSPELGSSVAVAIGACEPFATLEQPSDSTSSRVAFSWMEGDANTLATLQTGPASEAWRTALETRRTVGVDLRHPGTQGSAGRAVSIPLIAQGRLLGLLVAGLPSALASLATLERLELRASLAAAALARKQ